MDPQGASFADEKLDLTKVTLVYTLFNHLGDFVVMSSLFRKFDLLNVKFESIAAHQGSPHIPLFTGDPARRFFNIASVSGFFQLLKKLRAAKKAGRLIFGIPMAPGSLQAFFFFWILKKLGALTYIVDFNLNNADLITPVRRRYIFDRHLAQAAELFKHPEWLDDLLMPLGISFPESSPKIGPIRVGIFPWSGRSHLPEFQWSDAKWSELANRLLAQTDSDLVLLGRDSRFEAFAKTLQAALPESSRLRFQATPADSVPHLISGLQGLDYLITLNTSALHLGHSLQVPLVTLCGSTAEFWLPEGAQVRIVHDMRGALPASDKYSHDLLQPSVQRIEVAEVYAAFEDLVQKSNPPRFSPHAPQA